MEKKTVFVIGAGASKEANLPTGDELKITISKFLNIDFELSKLISGDPLIYRALMDIAKERKEDAHEYYRQGRHISESLPLAESIDNFLDQHRGNEKIILCGKLAIVRSILDAENQSHLRFGKHGAKPNVTSTDLNKTWYNQFFKMLTVNCVKSELARRFRSATLIVFNYDRCIEHFLFFALQKYYKHSEDEAIDLINELNIYHPYGVVGNLPWLNRKNSIEFGSTPRAEGLLNLSEMIKTFTEGTDPILSEISGIRRHVSAAERIVFLGFRFLDLNLRLIAPDDVTKSLLSRCFATTLGISPSDKASITGQITDLYKPGLKVDMADMSCYDFFSEYSRSLSF